MESMKKQKHSLSRKEIFLWVLVGFILPFFFFAIFNIPFYKNNQLTLPSNTQGIIYSLDDNQAIVKLDLNDPNAKLLLKDIETVCDGYKIKSCMSIFGGKLKPMTSQAMVSQGQVCPVK